MMDSMKSIPLTWIKHYVDALLDSAEKFDVGSPMRNACMLRADHALDLVDTWKRHGLRMTAPQGTEPGLRP